jgi:SRSO17 transposase
VSWKVPKTLRFHTKPQLAARMLTTLRGEAVVSWTSVVAACLYGNSPEFLAVLERESTRSLW